MNRSQAGIVHNSGLVNGQIQYLPLEELRVKILVIDVSARVSITQVFSNPSDTATSRSKYCFPVPASAAVCAFEMRTSDDRVVKGVCKEKDAAREEYEQAVSAGKFAGMLDYITDDIFTISVGSIPSQATVETKLVYVMSLMNEDTNSVRLQLPQCVGERYGTPPAELMDAMQPSSQTRVRITAEIQTNGQIQAITSPSHPTEILETKYATHLGRPSRRRSTIKFRSLSYLDRDFVLLVHAEGLDVPRCFAEFEQDPSGRLPDTIAMQLTIIPKLKLPPIVSQEYLFVVDRSGSMGGDRIGTAKRTLAMLLRMLPKEGTTFNIFSFGSSSSSLWTQSRPYNQSHLDIATQHVDTMDADYGGTEIRNALNAVFKSSNKRTPVAAFVLTDGEAHDIGPTIREVQTAVNNARSDAPLRVFTLGIGNGVSSAMCEGIARAGNGVCLFAVNTESIVLKCARLFRAGKSAFVKNVTLDWGVPGDAYAVNFTEPPTSPLTNLRPPPLVQQAPTQIHDLHADTRINVFAILTLRKRNVPKQVILRGQADGSGEPFEVIVPIRGVQLTDSEPGLPLVHTLAGWRLIQEHEEGKAPLPQASGFVTNDNLRKAAIVRLGERYQVASRYTSFVAIDSGQDDADDAQSHNRHVPRRRSPSPAGNITTAPSNANRSQRRSSTPPPPSRLQSIISSLFSGIFGGSPSLTADQGVPGGWPDSTSNPPSDRDSGESDEGNDSRSDRTFSTLSSLEGSRTDWSDWSRPPTPPPVSEEDARLLRSPSPQLLPERLAPDAVRQQRNRVPGLALPPRPPSPAPVQKDVVELVTLQRFDGSFALDESLRKLVGADAIQEAQVLRVDSVVWATALSVAYMSKHMANQQDMLHDLLAKALEFLKGQPDGERLVKRAKELMI